MGDLYWKFKTSEVVHASPALADGVLFFGSWDSYFYAVDAATGKEKWRFHAGEDPLIHNQVGFQSSPAVANGVVYTGCRDANLYALDAVTGKEKSRFNTELSWVITSPAVADGKVFFATSDSEFVSRRGCKQRQTHCASARERIHVFLAGDRWRCRIHRRAKWNARSPRC